MTALHAQSCCCYDCTPGFKAEAPRQVFDLSSLHGPFFPSRERRLECREANEKWLLVPSNRVKARASKAAYKRKIRDAKRNQGVAP